MGAMKQFAAIDLDKVWSDAWEAEKTAHSASTGLPEASWRTAGRSTKAHPNGEDQDWWFQAGRDMLDSWVKFRTNLGWDIWTAPNGIPAVEISMTPIFGDDIPVQMGIDRVMVTPDGELVVVDLKTGSRTPSSDLQLAFYAVGMSKMFGVRPQYGAYWMARTGATSTLVDLDFYTDEMIENLIVDFDRARKAELFLPNYGHCKMCGYTEKCKWNKEGK